METPETKEVAKTEAKPEVQAQAATPEVQAPEVKPEAPKAEAPKAGVVEKFMNIVQANGRIAELQADNTSLLNKVKDLEGQMEQAQNFVHEAATAKEQLNKEIETLKADHAKALDNTKAEYQAKIDALNKQLEDKTVALGNEVVTELASVGIQQGEIKQELSPALTPKVAFKTFNAMEAGPKRTAYFKANEKLIVEGSRSR